MEYISGKLRHSISEFPALYNYSHSPDYFLISLTYHSSSGWKPKKAFPSPPKFQGLTTSKDFKGRR